MSRDSINSAQYFEKYIAEQNIRIKKFENILNELPKNDKKKIRQCERYLANYYKDLMAAEYSAGQDENQINNIFKKYVSAICQCDDIDYAELADILSLSIILKVNVDDVIKKECIKPLKDELISYLLSFIEEYSYESKELLYEQYYRIFMDYALEKVSTQDFLYYIENEWYDSSKQFSWYNNHESKENVYVGYWCWLAAALIKLQGGVVKDSKYIPVDLIS